MNAVVVGYGVVGKAIAQVFGIDKWIDLKGSNTSYEEASQRRYIFLCLPTEVKNGLYDTSALIEVIKGFKDRGRQNVFIVKSTVYPGFADYVMDQLGINCVVSCPEFLSEKTADRDAKHPDKVVIGGRLPNYIEDVVGIHKARYKGVDIFTTDNVTAELAKWSVNGFYATKVVFANQVYDFAQKVNADYQTIEKIMYTDRYIGKNHLSVIHKGGRGAGGKCLRKDLEAFASMSQLPLLVEADKLNKKYLSENPK
jgi:UDPglucose 6-dehydrogenase